MVQVLGRREIMIIEDDPYALIRFEGEPLPAIFDYSGKNSIYMSSFSKTIAPGLRVGWMILPEEIAEDLAEEAASTYITPSLLSQAIVHEFIARGSFEPNLRRMNELIKVRRDAMLAALDKHFSGATVDAARGRLLRLARGADRHEPRRGARAREGRDGRASAPSSARRPAACGSPTATRRPRRSRSASSGSPPRCSTGAALRRSAYKSVGDYCS